MNSSSRANPSSSMVPRSRIASPSIALLLSERVGTFQGPQLGSIAWPMTHATGTDQREGQDRPQASLHLAGPSADAGVLGRDLATAQPAGCKRSGRGDDPAVRTRVGNPSPGHLSPLESRNLQGSSGAPGGDLERTGQGRNETAGHSDGRRPTGATGGSADPRSRVRGRLPRLLVWRSEEHTSELQSLAYLVCRLLLEK